MSVQTPTASARDEQLLTDVLGYASDPAGFVGYIFPWEEPGTPLEHETGPDVWQIEVLDYIAERLQTSADPIRIAVASGHGVGKTSLIAWLILWYMSTKPHPQIPVTASTGAQLSTKTWRELAKWHGLALNKHWFTWTATKYYRNAHPETWYASAIPWSKEKAQSFAGTHEEWVMVIYDEGSTVGDEVWEVTEGAMSTPQAIWFVPGNPEQPSGRFRDCFGRFRSLWKTWQIDARTAKKTNKDEIQRQIDAYGEDSDFVRVRWLGKFPRQGPTQFISEALVEQAQARTPEGYEHMPKILGVDVARFGPDETVLLVRQGQAILECQGYRGLRTDETADLVATLLEKDPNIVMAFIDVLNMGAGVVDQLQRLGYRRRVFGVIAGEHATELHPGSTQPKYFNLRAQMWGHMRDWLEHGGCLPRHLTQLAADLVLPKFSYAREQCIQLERKEDMEWSPDHGDALGFTFARPVALQAHEQRREVPKRVGTISRRRVTSAGSGSWMR